MEKHKIALCGASGFIGSNLSAHLAREGHTVVPLGRELFMGEADGALDRVMDGCDTVVNVAGATIDHRWSRRYKQVLYDSRIGVTRRLVGAISRSESVRSWICTSAVGYYPPEGCYDELLLVPGSDFLAGLCRAWEAEAFRAPERVRTVVTRFGVVMSPGGGVFPRLARPARMGVAVVTGSGHQPFSWVDIGDLCRAEEFLIGSGLGGVFNLTAPQQMTMGDAVRAVQAHYHAPLRIRVPEWALRLVRGEAADPLVRGQCVLPARLTDAGFEFHSPGFETFLSRLGD